MTDQELISQYYPLVPFLAQLCGPGCEVLLHDLSLNNGTVVCIENGLHSGRYVGSPLTDFALQIINDRLYETQNFLTNYFGTAKGKNFISSTFFIKNEERLIGLLCVNRDYGPLTAFEKAFAILKEQYNLGGPINKVQETLDVSVEILLENMINAAIQDSKIDPVRMSRKEKAAIIQHLADQGVLKMKGAITEISKQLAISVPTVYRYIHMNDRDHE